MFSHPPLYRTHGWFLSLHQHWLITLELPTCFAPLANFGKVSSHNPSPTFLFKFFYSILKHFGNRTMYFDVGCLNFRLACVHRHARKFGRKCTNQMHMFRVGTRWFRWLFGGIDLQQFMLT